MDAYEELPGHHLRSALDLVASTPVSEYQDSTKTLGMEHRTIASYRYDPRDRRPHMHPSSYYLGTSNSDSADNSYDLTRECFHIDGAIASDLEAEAAVGGRNVMPPHVEYNLSRFKNCKLSSMRNERTCAYFSKPSSRSVRRAHVAEELEREPAMSIIASSSQPERRRRRHASPQYA
jgi:hypothetical protein